jgi:hypothetical protein
MYIGRVSGNVLLIYVAFGRKLIMAPSPALGVLDMFIDLALIQIPQAKAKSYLATWDG